MTIKIGGLSIVRLDDQLAISDLQLMILISHGVSLQQMPSFQFESMTIDRAEQRGFHAYPALCAMGKREHLGLGLVDVDRDPFGLGPHGSLFSSAEGDLVDPANFRKRQFRRAVLGAGLDVDGLPNVVPYSWRHSQGTWLLAAGVPVAEAAKRLGHARQQTILEWYSHPLRDGQTAAMRSVGGFLADNLRTVESANVVPLMSRTH